MSKLEISTAELRIIHIATNMLVKSYWEQKAQIKEKINNPAISADNKSELYDLLSIVNDALEATLAFENKIYTDKGL